MVHYSKIVNGVCAFVERDMISKINGSLKAWGVGTFVALMAKKAPEAFSRLQQSPMVQMLGLIDGEMVDVDTIYQTLLEQARAHPTAVVDIPLVGSVTYSPADIENLYHCITDNC